VSVALARGCEGHCLPRRRELKEAASEKKWERKDKGSGVVREEGGRREERGRRKERRERKEEEESGEGGGRRWWKKSGRRRLGATKTAHAGAIRLRGGGRGGTVPLLPPFLSHKLVSTGGVASSPLKGKSGEGGGCVCPSAHALPARTTHRHTHRRRGGGEVRPMHSRLAKSDHPFLKGGLDVDERDLNGLRNRNARHECGDLHHLRASGRVWWGGWVRRGKRREAVGRVMTQPSLKLDGVMALLRWEVCGAVWGRAGAPTRSHVLQASSTCHWPPPKPIAPPLIVGGCGGTWGKHKMQEKRVGDPRDTPHAHKRETLAGGEGAGRR
jgi:hypothetical protein